MIRLAVISGKGGTGKTMVTAGLAALHRSEQLLADCDVEASNLELLLGARQLASSPFEGGECAVIDPERCNACGLCVEACAFDALTIRDEVAVCELRDCEGCGLCERVCPSGAVTLVPRVTGTLFWSATDYGYLSHARLTPGAGNSGLLVQRVKQQAEQSGEEVELLLIDGPPGSGCPLISTVNGTDAVLIVTEPSLSGLSDLVRVVRVARRFHPRIFVLINRWDLDTGMTARIEAECTAEGLTVIGRIPFDPAVIQAVRDGEPITHTDSPAADALAACWERLREALLY